MAGFFKGDASTQNDVASSDDIKRLQGLVDELIKQVGTLSEENQQLSGEVANLRSQVGKVASMTDAGVAEKTERAIDNITLKVEQIKNDVDNKMREANSKNSQTQKDMSDVISKIIEVEHTIKTLDSVVEAQSETIQNQIQFYSNFFSEHFTDIFGEKFISETKERFLEELKGQTQETITATAADYLRGMLTDYLRDSIRHEVIVGLSGQKEIGKDALKAIVDTVSQNVVNEIIKELADPAATMGGSGRGAAGIQQPSSTGLGKTSVEPFDPKKEHTHQEFESLLGLLEVGLYPMLVGPAGTGKSTAAEQAARALGLPFYSANRVSNAYELTGFINAGGNYMPTQFYEAYKNGGVFLFDEIDASDPEALVTFNNALASNYMCFPCGMVKKHPNFKVVAAANTYGTGLDENYTGRSVIDAATRNRFVVLDWGYDTQLESEIIEDKKQLKFCWHLREVCEMNHLNIIVGTRDLIYFQKTCTARGFDLAKAIRVSLLEGVPIDTIKSIKGGLVNKMGYEADNKFIRALDTIVEREYEASNTK